MVSMARLDRMCNTACDAIVHGGSHVRITRDAFVRMRAFITCNLIFILRLAGRVAAHGRKRVIKHRDVAFALDMMGFPRSSPMEAKSLTPHFCQRLAKQQRLLVSASTGVCEQLSAVTNRLVYWLMRHLLHCRDPLERLKRVDAESIATAVDHVKARIHRPFGDTLDTCPPSSST